jgi:hypothetical protein
MVLNTVWCAVYDDVFDFLVNWGHPITETDTYTNMDYEDIYNYFGLGSQIEVIECVLKSELKRYVVYPIYLTKQQFVVMEVVL